METYSIGLALVDFIPVILSSVGLWWIASMVKSTAANLGQMATLGWLLVTIGGAFKAIWKLIMALTDAQTNIVFMDKGLFLWLGIGFLLLSYAVSYAARIRNQNKPRSRIWPWPAVSALLFLLIGFFMGFPDPEGSWRFLFLGVMTIGNVVLVLLLIRHARRSALPLAAILFLVNIVLVFVLSGMARIPTQTIALQWIEEIINSGAQGAFCLAAWQLSTRGRR